MTVQVFDPAPPKNAVPARMAAAPVRPVTRTPAASHELSAVAARRGGAIEVGSADDPLELAADRVAEGVLRGCACGGAIGSNGECARCKPARPPGRSVAPPVVHEVLKTPGAPLDVASRAFFEPRLGADLSGVRVHRDASAAASADAVDALAYTVGSDIVFADGRYSPATADGRRLMAHELAHVVQQRTAPAVLARAPAATMTPAEHVAQLLAEGEGPAIRDITDEDIAAATPQQRAGLIRILTDLAWTSYDEELATVRMLRHGGLQAQVTAALDVLGYRQKVLDSVQDDDLYAEIEQLFGAAPAPLADGPIAAALSSQSADDVVAITDFTTATAPQRLGLLRILLALWWSNPPEEAKMLDILASAGADLRTLMAALTETGLKQSLFDHIDEPANMRLLDALLTPLNDPVLHSDLEVFKQGFVEGAVATFISGVGSAWENLDIGAVIVGFFHPLLHPIDTLVGLFGQIEDLTKDPTDLDRSITLLRDATGLVALWLAALATACNVIALAFGASVVLVPGGLSVGVIAASVLADAAAVGAAFLVLAAVKLARDVGQGAKATTAAERDREVREAGEGVTLFGLIAVFGGLAAGINRLILRVRGAATDAKQADPTALEKTAEEGKKTAEASKETAEKMKEESGADVTTGGQVTGATRRRFLTAADIRAMRKRGVDVVSWRTKEQDVAANQPIKQMRQTNPNAPDVIFFGDGYRGFNYGDFFMIIEKEKVTPLYPRQQSGTFSAKADEWYTTASEIPADMGYWTTIKEIVEAMGE